MPATRTIKTSMYSRGISQHEYEKVYCNLVRRGEALPSWAPQKFKVWGNLFGSFCMCVALGQHKTYFYTIIRSSLRAANLRYFRGRNATSFCDTENNTTFILFSEPSFFLLSIMSDRVLQALPSQSVSFPRRSELVLRRYTCPECGVFSDINFPQCQPIWKAE